MTLRFHGISWLNQVNPSIVYIILLGITVFLPILESPDLIQAKLGYSFSLSGDHCVSIDCVKEKVRYMCKEDYITTDRPAFLNCYGILKCLDINEELQTYCASGSDSHTPQSLRLIWVVLRPCTTEECIQYCMFAPLPAPPECARMVLL
jgi:hypothetical protein